MSTLSLRPRSTARLLSTLALLAIAGSSAVAQVADPAPARPAAPVQNPLNRPISVRFASVPLRDALAYLEQVAGLSLRPLWIDENHAAGLDPDLLVKLNSDRITALAVIERLLTQSNAGTEADGSTWQVAADGALEIGPRSRLNVSKRTVVYDIKDLLHVAPAFTDAPTIDLAAALRGDGGSVLREETDQRETLDPAIVRAEDLMDLITETVEPDQWAATGGSGATMRLYQGQLVVHAPGYIHRQLATGILGRY